MLASSAVIFNDHQKFRKDVLRQAQDGRRSQRSFEAKDRRWSQRFLRRRNQRCWLMIFLQILVRISRSDEGTTIHIKIVSESDEMERILVRMLVIDFMSNRQP